MFDSDAFVLADLPYTYGYFHQISPSFLQLAALSKGIRFDPGERLRYLELGFGQGVSLNVHAAARAGEYWGNDLSAAHVAHARDLAAASGSEVRLSQDSFVELASRDDLPDFHVIALHGIWSWVRDQDRAAIVEIAKRRLAPGGLLYVSYNCSTAWSAAVALRQLIQLHAGSAPHDLPTTTKIMNAIAFAQSLADAGATYFNAHPGVLSQLKQLSGKNATYLAHEFLGQDWRLMSFAEIAAALEPADLHYAASTFLHHHNNELSLRPAGRDAVAALADPILRETVRDCFLNTQFRQDLFVKGAAPSLSATERLAQLRAQRFALTSTASERSLEVRVPIGVLSFEPRTFAPIFAALAEHDYAPKTVGYLESAIGKGKPVDKLFDELIFLTGASFVQPAQSDVLAMLAMPACKALNDVLCSRARYSSDIGVLASPMLGAGVRLGTIKQLFLLARAEGKETPHDWAAFALKCLDASKRAVVRQGKKIGCEAECLSELTRQANLFATESLPVLKALGVAQSG